MSKVDEFILALGRGEEPVGVGTRIIQKLEAELEKEKKKWRKPPWAVEVTEHLESKGNE